MKIFATQIQAICVKTGESKLFEGPRIKANSIKDAEFYCQNNGLGYCFIVGELVDEIDNINHYSLN